MEEDADAQEDELLALESILGPEEVVVARGAAGGTRRCGELRVSVELPGDFFVAVKDGDAFVYFGVSSLPPLTISALDTHLAGLYQATGGDVVLFSWVQFLKEDTLSFLNINSLLVLPSNENSPATPDRSEPSSNDLTPPLSDPPPPTEALSDKGTTDDAAASLAPSLNACSLILPLSDEEKPSHGVRRAGQIVKSRDNDEEDDDATSLLSSLLVHDEAQKRRMFAASVLECGVCLAPVLGSVCVRLGDCGHVYCERCLARFLRGLISEGNVRGVTCAQPGCKTTPTPAQVKKLVGDELFDRYDRLLFQATLDSMSDVVYCPRVFCASAVITDGEVAQCSVCGFAFCVTCRKNSHGAGLCPATAPPHRRPEENQEELGYSDIPHSLVGMMALWDDYSGGSAQRKKLLEKRYGVRVLRTTMSEYLNDGWYFNNETKNCPQCSVTIQKNVTGGQRAKGTDQRAKGTDQRAKGTDQRAKGTGQGDRQRTKGTDQRTKGTDQRANGTDQRAKGTDQRGQTRGPTGQTRGPRGQTRGPRGQTRGDRPEGQRDRPEDQGDRPEGQGDRPE
ncbi:hypothetical protein NHX12_033050, partial [Muraenolepis orangiensis]